MIADRSRLFEAIRSTLSDKLLEGLSPASWPASHLRTCLTLLAYLEDLVESEEAILSESNTQMRALLDDLAARRPAWLTVDLAGRLAMIGQDANPTIRQREADYQLLRQLLVEVIRSHGTAQRSGQPDADFQHRLRACLTDLNAREFAVAQRSTQMPPF